MHVYSAGQWVLLFFFYCFCGWVWESCYVSICRRQWVNRGFLHGPLLPIYGSGAIIILFVTLPAEDHLWLVWLLGMAAATALEYITGAVMERLFKVRYWDYSHHRFNLNGHICLSSSIAWGFFSIFLVRFLHPPVGRLLVRVPDWLVDPAALEPMGFQLDSGRWPDTGPANKKATKLQVLVGDYTGYNFYDSRKSETSPNRYRWQGMTDAQGNQVDPFVNVDKDKMTLTIKTGEGSTEKTQTWELEVVGHIQQDASKGWWTQSNIILRTQDLKMIEEAYYKMAKITNNNTSYDQVYVKVDDLKNVADVEKAIHDLGFENTYSMNQQREEMQKQVVRSQMIFGGVAAVSLLVAAINIINTMTMAIYERTREIGVMKVLGCELGNIRTMFLMESSCIGFLGGVIGVAISLLVSFILNHLSVILSVFGQSIDLSGLLGGGMYMGGMSSTISVIPPWLMLAALVFATLVGLVSGVLPANNAVKISALEAIRHD